MKIIFNFTKPVVFLVCFGLLLLFTTCKKEITPKEGSASSIHYLIGGANDNVQKIERTNDGGFIFCGYTNAGDANTQAFMLKVDAAGNKQWYKTYGDVNYDLFHDAIQCSDGGFVAVGRTTMTGGGAFTSMDYVLKTDANGNREWSKSFSDGDLALCELRDVTEGSDHYLYATGNYPSMINWMASWILKFDLKGNKVYSKAIEALASYQPKKFITDQDVGWGGGMDIEMDSKGAILMSVQTTIYSPTFETVPSLLSVTGGGIVNFYYPYSGRPMGSGYFQTDTKSEINKIVCTHDGYYLCWNRDSVTPTGIWPVIVLQKTDPDGNPLWIKTYRGLGSALVFDVLKQADGSLLIAGSTSTFPLNNLFPESFYNSKALVLKVDANGNSVFQEYSGNDNNTNFFKSIQNAGTELMAAGYTCLNTIAYDKMFIAKLNTYARLKSK